ncbi:hypothetical protein HOB10_05390 [Candidatus Parcubacteria bacterium]|jgi:hypothetical protein|nr:hypothetical protein [Candidatus Parcubacteria bacterium]
MTELINDLLANCSDVSYAAWCVSIPGLLQRATIGEFNYVMDSLPGAIYNRPIEELDLGAEKNLLLKQNNIHTIGQLIKQARQSGLLPEVSPGLISEAMSKISFSDNIH